MRTLLDYVLEGELGRGAHAIVHRARRLPSEQVVALKRPTSVDDAGRDRLRHEARVLARCVHPHVVPLLDVVAPGEDDPPQALALGLAPGGSLATHLRNSGPLAPDEVAGLALAIAEALAVVHAAGYAHGDVKPGNILLGPAGVPWLADFDAATLIGGQATDGSGPPRGTLPYAAPEILAGDPPDACSDLRALGVTCLEALGPDGAERADGPLLQLLEAAASDDRAERPEDLQAFVDTIIRTQPRRCWPARLGSREVASIDDPDEAPTRDFGPRPPTPRSPVSAGDGHLRRRALLAGSSLGLAVTLAALFVVSEPAPANRSDLPGTPSAEAPSAQGAGPCAAGDPAASDPDPTTVLLSGDLTGEGCTRTVRWSPATAEAVVEGAVGPRRYRIGQPGDELALGDWDGDRRDEPALYRPSTGEVFTFAAWAPAGGPVASAPVVETGIVAGRARVVRTAGHDRVTVEPIDAGP